MVKIGADRARKYTRCNMKNVQNIVKVARNMYNSLIIILWKFERILTNTIGNICHKLQKIHLRKTHLKLS